MKQGKQECIVKCPVGRDFIVIEGIEENIFHCIYTRKDIIEQDSPIQICRKPSICLEIAESQNFYTIATKQLELHIDKKSGQFIWTDQKSGHILLQEGQKELTETPYIEYQIEGEEPIIRREKTVDGERNFIENLKPIEDHIAFRGKMTFDFQESEHIYGFGQGEEGIYDYRGSMQYLYQHNMRTPIPFMLSSKNYAILFNCGSLMTFNDDSRGSYVYLDTVEQIDYYFIAGDTVDELIKAYRILTGKASMLPKWSFGYIQSKETYHDQQELLDVALEYRLREIPIDCIVQDWHTWEEGKWGNKHVDRTRYPDIATMNNILHHLKIHSMISIWPNMNYGTEDYEEMAKKGYLLKDYSTYNAFSSDARKLYWKQLQELFLGGFDSWWCDSTEPFSGPDWNGQYKREPWERFLLVGNEHKKFLKPDQANLYAVEHAKGIYENQREAAPNKRVLNLTRSGYASSQKYGTVLWSGDISASWDVLRKQIAEGLNMALSGIPYWTLDVGGFFTVKENWEHRGCFCNADPTPKWFWCGEYENGVEDAGYRELYVRWLQFAVFLPIFRSHGTDTPREVWQFGEPGSMFYDAIVEAIRLRYRLMPYIYSIALRVWREDYTMMRSLLFDFPEDEKAASISSEYMFGDSLLICPITSPMFYEKGNKAIDIEPVWECYLPSGCGWYDFYTEKYYEGGQTIQVSASLCHIPVFVKEGSVLPMEMGLMYAQEKVDTPLVIRIYPGRDSTCYLYEDSGDGYDYENGDYHVIPIHWNDKRKELKIGLLEGKYQHGIVGRTCEGDLNGIRQQCVYHATPVTLLWH